MDEPTTPPSEDEGLSPDDDALRVRLGALAAEPNSTSTAAAQHSVVDRSHRARVRRRSATAVLAVLAVVSTGVVVASRHGEGRATDVRTTDHVRPPSTGTTTTTWPWVTSTTAPIGPVTHARIATVRTQVRALLESDRYQRYVRSIGDTWVDPHGGLLYRARPVVWVQLRADATPLARLLRARFGEDVLIEVGHRIYPTGRTPAPPFEHPCTAYQGTTVGTLPGHPAPPPPKVRPAIAATLRLDAPTVRSGDDFRGRLRITNRSHASVGVNVGTALATVIDPRSRTTLAESESVSDLMAVVEDLRPGKSLTLSVEGSTTRCTASGPPALGPGRYTVVVLIPVVFADPESVRVPLIVR